MSETTDGAIMSTVFRCGYCGNYHSYSYEMCRDSIRKYEGAPTPLTPLTRESGIFKMLPENRNALYDEIDLLRAANKTLCDENMRLLSALVDEQGVVKELSRTLAELKNEGGIHVCKGKGSEDAD
jgi:hypothetical protein